MATYNATSRINLEVNGSQANKIFNQLKKEAEQLRKKIDEAALAGDKVAMKKLQQDLNNNKRLMQQLSTETASVEQTLSRLDRASPKELNKTLNSLRKQLNNIERGSEAWKKQVEMIKRVKAEIDKVNASLRNAESRWNRMNRWLNDCQTALMGFAAAITGFVMAGRKAVNSFADMDEQLANTRKYTGMAEDSVIKLNSSFKKLDSRTPRDKLNELAQEAGRLGKNTLESVNGYVEAADIINVALVDLGAGATQTIAKLTNIFGVEQILGTKEAMLAVGSTVNVLSQNCTASKPYLVEFAQRMAGIGSQAGLTIPQILAFGAVLDANGQKVEMSATAIQKVIMNLANKNKEFANTVGLDAKKLKDTLENSAKDGLIMFLEALQKMGKSVGFNNATMTLAPAFKDMGLDAARVSQVLSTLAMHLDEVKWQIGEADKAFAQASSATHEYEIFNNTAQAAIDKAKKRVSELAIELGEKLYPVMKHIYTSSGIFLRVLNTMVAFFLKYKKEILSVVGAIAAYNAILLIHNARLVLAAKASVLFNSAIKVASGLLPALRLLWVPVVNGIQYFTNGLQVNYEMQLRWRKAMEAMKFSSWTGLILALASAVYIFSNRLSESRKRAEETARAYAEAESQAMQSVASELKELESLYKVTQDQNASMEVRLKAIEKLRMIYPEYFKDISNEAFLAGQAADAYDRLKNSILDSARAKGRESMISKLEGEIQDLQAVYEKEVSPWITKRLKILYEKGDDAVYDPEYRLVSNTIDIIDKKYKPSISDKQKLQDSLASQNARYKLENSDLPDTPSDIPIDEPLIPRQLSEKERKKREREARAAAVKARKEFKDALKDIKGERDTQLADLLSQRAVGDLNYREYQQAKYDAEKRFYNDSLALYEKWSLQEDADYAALLKKREEHEAQFNSERISLNRDAIRRIAAVEERDVQMRFAFRKNKSLSDELQLQEELMSIRYNALLDEQNLYGKGTKEFEQMEEKIQDLLYADLQAKKKLLYSKANEFQQKFDSLSVKEKYDLEFKALETLYNEKYISEAQFQKWKSDLEKQQKKDLADELKNLPGSAESKTASVRKNFDSQKTKLDDALKKGTIDADEYAKRLSRIKAEMNAALVDPLRTSQSEWVVMLTTAYQAWADFAAALKDPDANPFDSLAAGISASAAVVTSVMSQITEFQKAEYEMQAAAVEKRYDKEIAYAEGNSYLTKKLEKEKQEELDRLKAEQSKKNFQLQIISTIAQTAANAVQAYNAGLSVGGPAGLVLAPIAAAMAVAQGAVQIALLKKQQQAAAAVGYSEGGFTRPGRVDEPAGIVHAGEWVASQKLVNSPNARPLIEYLEYAQRNNRIGSISMQDVSRSVAAPMFNAFAPARQQPVIIQQTPPTPQVSADPELSAAISRLNRRLDSPFVTVNSVTGEGGINEAEKRYNRMIRNKSRRFRS